VQCAHWLRRHVRLSEGHDSAKRGVTIAIKVAAAIAERTIAIKCELAEALDETAIEVPVAAHAERISIGAIVVAVYSAIIAAVIMAEGRVSVGVAVVALVVKRLVQRQRLERCRLRPQRHLLAITHAVIYKIAMCECQ